ncbi:MAG: hypothetical protein Q9166_000998 [cf. Caloplaca sp. 2 TL-2023]
MHTKAQGYGKKGRQNVAVLMQQLHMSSPKATASIKAGDRSIDEHVDGDDVPRQPLAPVDPNAKKVKKAEEAKAKACRARRRSFLPKEHHQFAPVDLNDDMKRHLQPLLSLKDVASSVLNFDSWAAIWTHHCLFDKIAQGAFGAVYRIRCNKKQHASTIGKLIPLQSRSGWGSKTKEFTKVEVAANEVFFLSTLDEIAGFVEFRKAEVLYGRLPNSLVAASKWFENTHHDTSPRFHQACKNREQLWLFIEMSDGGMDLEKTLTINPGKEHSLLAKAFKGDPYLSAVQVRDIFWQVASALAIAEKKFEFEHRDLHLGNICLSYPALVEHDSSPRLWTDKPSIAVTIIDYTMSRAKVEGSDVVFNNLSADPQLFKGQGNAQYDVYRAMREHSRLYSFHWEAYIPLTNVMWLHHLLEMLVLRATMKYQGKDKKLWVKLNNLKEYIKPSTKAFLTSAQEVVAYCETDTPV